MGGKKKEISIDLRNLMVRLHAKGKSCSEIAKDLGVCKSTVIYNINKQKICGSVKNLPRKGRPRKLTSRTVRGIKSTMMHDRFVSARKLAEQVRNTSGTQVHARTINRALQREGFVSRVPRKLPTISAKNVQARLAYARKYINMPISYWNKALWTDESKFNVKRSDGRLRVWRKGSNSFEQGTIIRTYKHGNGSLMVWGCMAASGPGKLVFIDGIMTKTEYLAILKHNVIPSVRQLGLGDDFLFVQDNDPKHKAGEVMDYFDKKGWEVQDHPAQSPDLNVIEHLWDEIDRRIDRSSVNNVQQLKIQIQNVWSSIEPSVTQKLVESMPRRLQAVIDAKGHNTRY